ncbi:tyrosine--tRNA ligase [Actinomyces bowdenii]|uniref:tyrosine--tRNA ligase n=1 Tax=Actinomyces bowdenii TaxID=131109 RepID=UPI00214CDF60|nr:tyrosine--tRNA ligase [Actinomyces bowdenii]MCR2052958.1 tyrosine--tRNA ligase [Actinomyces bowdenii]
MPRLDKNSDYAESEAKFASRLSEITGSANAGIAGLGEVLRERRKIDLRSLSIETKISLIATHCQHVIPGVAQLADRLSRHGMRLKFGIDPTGAEVHLGHAVPIVIADRLRRMGLEVDFIVGDMTATIGDPSGRTADRPPLSRDEVAANLATYKEQISPFFDFDDAHFHYNSTWLESVTLPELLELLARIPVSATMQRDDFRKRMASGAGLSMAEQLYSVVMALDSVALKTDIEIGGIDQLLNMQMCRRVMGERGQEPELILTTPLIEGIDGSGAKMSKSQGNYVPLAAPPNEVFGRIMAIPDRLTQVYLGALTEITTVELDQVTKILHPMAAKRLLAHVVTATLHGHDNADAAQDEFRARFSMRSFCNVSLPDLVLRTDADVSLLDALRAEWLSDRSRADIRRVAKQGGLRLVDDGKREFLIDEYELARPVRSVLADSPFKPAYVRVGKHVARIVG